MLVFLLLVAQTVWADFMLTRFIDNVQSRGMMLYFTAWVVLLSIPLLNRYLRVVAIYTIMFLLARGFSRITDEQDPVRVAFSILPGISLGIKIGMPLLAVALALKAVEWILRSLGLFSKEMTTEEIREAMNKCLTDGKPLAEFQAQLDKAGVPPAKIKEWLHQYEKRLQARNGFEETI